MAHLIDKDAVVAELERRKKAIVDDNGNLGFKDCQKAFNEIDELKKFINTLEVKEVDLENYNKVKRLLSLSFMHFLDTNRPEGKMCLSNGECFDIEKAFDELDFAKLFRYMEKYLKAQKGE